MFYNASSFNQPVNHFKTKNITNLQSTFQGATGFNQPLDQWDV
ncbi:MAG: DUF285 domain-containing protein, partial [Candidatus Peribacteria bacterium]|nr:DUF285 domain-containing protein [Candidatus Peribacteria bacterium]